MVEVVLHLVVFWEAEEVASLHCQEIVYCGLAYAHHFCKILGLGLGFRFWEIEFWFGFEDGETGVVCFVRSTRKGIRNF